METYKQNPMDIIIGFDHREELDRAVQRARSNLALINPNKSIFKRSSKEEERRAKEHIDRASAVISSAQEDYMNRLESAYKSKAISRDDYFDAKMNVQFGPFDRLLRDVRDIYWGK